MRFSDSVPYAQTYIASTMPKTILPLEEELRFWGLVRKGEGKNACWLYTAGTTREGYGIFTVRSVFRKRVAHLRWTAHRLAFALKHGREAKGMVLHACDVPACVRHVREGTAEENGYDHAIRGRWKPRGNGSPRLVKCRAIWFTAEEDALLRRLAPPLSVSFYIRQAVRKAARAGGGS
jgi:hypothetical protein